MAKEPSNRGSNSTGAGRASKAPRPAEENSKPEIEEAREQLRQARDAMRAAEDQYVNALEGTLPHLDDMREASVGQAIDQTLNWVKHHPGAGLCTAAAVGYFMGRIVRRFW